jgi:HAD superfamily 5'-nucleotidase-like hydrolase
VSPRAKHLASLLAVDAIDASQQVLPLADLAPAPEGQLPRARRIWCNRNLRLDQIEVVGFDMDYTLAVYAQEALDRLSVQETAKKLVAIGYPAALLEMPYPTQFPIRGLLVDRKLGNVLKPDRHRYAKRAYHGTRELPSEERRRLYQARRVRPGTRRYHSIDTLYETSEVAVFVAAVDVLEGLHGKVDYGRLYDDIRRSIDQAHRDGSIKGVIAGAPERYLLRDPELPALLHKLRSAGKKTFLLTNSESTYTETVMRYLLEPGKPEYTSWRGYFDVVVTDAQKPRFFTEARTFEEVPDDGAGRETRELARGHVYRGGSLPEFERLLGVRGDHVLYIGDHIYGDVLRAKKDSAWRTLMIIQEMTGEVAALERYAPEIERLRALEQRRDALLDTLHDRQGVLRGVEKRLERDSDQAPDSGERVEMEAVRVRLRRSVDRIRGQLKAIDGEYDELERMVERASHPFWGSPFKAESEMSSFGEQVERYACLYTDRVTNLLHYSASHYFRGPRHRMAHE